MKYFRALYLSVFLITLAGCASDDRIDEAGRLFRQGDYDTVEKILNHVLYSYPRNVPGLVLQCELKVAQKRWNDAFWCYDSLTAALEQHHLPILEHICREFLLDGAASPYENVRRKALAELSILRDASMASIFLSGITDSSHVIRSECVKALGLIGDASSIQSLRNLLSGEDFITRSLSAAALFVIGEEEKTGAILQNAFSSVPFPVQKSILEIVEPVRRPEILPILRSALNSRSRRVRLDAVEHILGLGRQELVYNALEKILAEISDNEQKILAGVFDIMGRCSLPGARSRLMKCARGTCQRTTLKRQLLAMRSIARRKIPFTDYNLDTFLNHPELDVRLLAAETLYYVNPGEGRLRLISLFNEHIRDIDFMCRTSDPQFMKLLTQIIPGETLELKRSIGLTLSKNHNLTGITPLITHCQSGEYAAAYRAAGAIMKIVRIFCAA